MYTVTNSNTDTVIIVIILNKGILEGGTFRITFIEPTFRFEKNCPILTLLKLVA